jgi:hypothetical protein
MRLFAFAALLAVLLGAAIGFRPQVGEVPRPFQVTRHAYDRVETGVTPVAQLPGLGFDLSRGDRLSYLAMIARLMPEDSTGFDTLDSVAQVCLEARDRCQAYRFALAGRPGSHAILVLQAGHVARKTLEGPGVAKTAALD